MPTSPALVTAIASRMLSPGSDGIVDRWILWWPAISLGMAPVVGSIAGLCLVCHSAGAQVAKHDVGLSRSSRERAGAGKGYTAAAPIPFQLNCERITPIFTRLS